MRPGAKRYSQFPGSPLVLRHVRSGTLQPIGVVRSRLTALEAAPLQRDEGAPEAWLDLTAPAAPGLLGSVDGTPVLDIKAVLGPSSER